MSRAAEDALARASALFDEHGFIVLERQLDRALCSALLREVISSFSAGRPSRVLATPFRAHYPMPMNDVVENVIRGTVTSVYELLDAALPRDRRLVELSSITVFPGAESQPLHRDEMGEGKQVISIFINLSDTHESTGALNVYPGSHKTTQTPDEAERSADGVALALPAGSVVIMNGKLLHRGLANTSPDRIRPVFYFSFGDGDIEGPVYSIREELRNRYVLGDFRRSSSAPGR